MLFVGRYYNPFKHIYSVHLMYFGEATQGGEFFKLAYFWTVSRKILEGNIEICVKILVLSNFCVLVCDTVSTCVCVCLCTRKNMHTHMATAMLTESTDKSEKSPLNGTADCQAHSTCSINACWTN